MLLEDLSDYLTSGGITSTMHLGTLNPTPLTAIALYETGGTMTEHVMGNTAGAAVVERPRVQFVARSTSFTAARADIHRVFTLVDGMPARAINGVQYLWAYAVQSPFLLDRDDNGVVRLAFNAEFMKELSTTS